jgi:hypothetical protein
MHIDIVHISSPIFQMWEPNENCYPHVIAVKIQAERRMIYLNLFSSGL